MKEHETIYICRACENGTPGKTKSYTRKANLAKHIAEYHKVSKLKAAALADTWRRKDGRRYYSCGFCVVLFHTIMEQLNHIDTDHFRHFQAVSDWDANKVIRGLLLQPEVNTILRKMLGTYYDAASEGLTWDSSITRSLQLRLELSEESAEDLSAAVANQGTWNVTTQGLVSTGLANDFSDHQMVHDLNLVPAQCDAIMPPVYTDLNAAPALTEMTATTQFLENGDFTPAFNLPDHVTTRSSYMCLGMPEPQIPLPDTSLDAGYHHASLVVRPAWQPSNTSNSVQPQHSSSPDWSQLQDRHSLGSMESSSMTDGSWSDAAFSASSNPTSRSHSSLLHYPSVSTANNAFGTEVSSLTSQPTVLSMDYAEDDTTDTESSLLSARIKKQRSRNKLRTYYEAPDLDIEELQRVMHDQDHTRSTWSQKRRR